MKLCFIANPNTSHTRRWLSYFARRGYDVHLIAEHRLRTPFAEVTVHDLTAITNVRKLRYLVWAVIVRRLVHRLRPDILHAHQVSSAGWLGWAASHHPFVVTPWGSDIYRHPQRSRLARWLAQRVLSSADLVTADSADLLARTIELGADPTCSHIIQWGVDLTTFSPVDERAELRSQLGLGSEFIILSARAMRPIYQHNVTLEAIATVRQTIPDVTFIFRDYNADPPDYAAQLARRAQFLGVSDAIRFIGPTARYEDVVNLYRAADLVVSVPASDGTPVSVLEALACGIPVIVSDLPSLREWIIDGESGVLVPVGNAEAVAHGIIRLLMDHRLYQQALQIIRERADHAAWMAQMEALYQGLVQ
jgi:glycosyltransferase involved in cell wall biosynthesis